MKLIRVNSIHLLYSNGNRKWTSTLWNVMEVYGGIIAYYGTSIGVLFAASISPILNEFQGGCKYAYVSEVARRGIGWWSFFLGSLIGFGPWIVFSWHYFFVMRQFASTIPVTWKRVLYLICQWIILLFSALSAVGMVMTAAFEMGSYPLTHEIVLLSQFCHM